MVVYRAYIQGQRVVSGESGIQALLDIWMSSGVNGVEESTTETKTEMSSARHWTDSHTKLRALLDLLTEKEIQPMLFLAERLLSGRDEYGEMEEWPGDHELILDAAEEAADLFQYLLWFLKKLEEKTDKDMEAAGRVPLTTNSTGGPSFSE